MKHTLLLMFLINSSLLFSQQNYKQSSQQINAKVIPTSLYTTSGRVDASTGIIRAQYHTDKSVLNGTPEEIARTYIGMFHKTFGFSESAGELALQNVQQSRAGYHVRFHQTVNNIPVYRGDVVVSINSNNQVTFVVNNSKQKIKLKNRQPSLSERDAEQLAHKAIDIQGKVLFQESPSLYILAHEQQSYLTYRVVTTTDNPRGVWEVFVDALSGEILQQEDIAVYERKGKKTSSSAFQGSGYVFNPDPLTSGNATYGSTGYVDGNDAATTQLNNQRKLIQLLDITKSGSVYSLEGPFVTVDDWDTPNIPVVTATHPDSFRFTRNQTGFEDVTVYYHLDSSQRYIQSLGYSNIQNLSIHVDPHGFNGEDNAFYNPSNNSLSFGQGGVDDAEDADVILHEYGHAIHYGTVAGWGDGEEGAIGEGFGDYWAATYSRMNNPVFSRNFFPTWDAGYNGSSGQIWSGRPLNDTRIYPNSGVAALEVHNAGQIWSAILLILWDELGKDIMDQLVLQSHFYMGTSGTMRDNAAAILQADNDLFAGEHLPTLIAKFSERNFLARPTISHQPLRDVEQTSAPFNVSVNITDGFYPLDTASGIIVWGKNGAFTDTTSLHQFNFSSEYRGAIPADGTPAQYQYYLVANDTAGRVVTLPENAPASYFSFYAGPDTVKPSVHFTPLYDQYVYSLPSTIRMTATDNIGIDSVIVQFSNQRSATNGTFPLTLAQDSTFENTFPFDTLNTQVGDSIYYSITIKDAATLSNEIHLPPDGYYKFRISSGNVLLVVDDTSHVAPVSSFSLFHSTLLSTTFSVDSVLWKRLPNRTLENYHLIILSSGLNILPLAQTSYRQAIVDFVLNGGKVLTEGGETGHFYREGGPFDADPYFRRVVLHDSSWVNNAAGSNLAISSPTHRIFTTPNSITSPIMFSDRTSGSFAADRDAMRLMPNDPNAKLAGTWTGESGTGGIVVYTQPLQPAPQTIFFSFALSSITDSTVAKRLVENTLSAFFPRSQITAVEQRADVLPKEFSLEQNYPNPFNPLTVIRYSLSVNSLVSLKVYDVLGREIQTLVDEFQVSGFKSLAWDASNIPSGVYFYRLILSDAKTNELKFLKVQKALLLK